MKIRIATSTGPLDYPPILVHSQAADLLDLSPDTVTDAIRRDAFPYPQALVQYGSRKNSYRVATVPLLTALGIPFELVSP